MRFIGRVANRCVKGDFYMNLWLMKSEPDVFGWDDLVRDGKTEWDGVRNYTAAGNLRAMKVELVPTTNSAPSSNLRRSSSRNSSPASLDNIGSR